jgi:hypothetical protein
MMDEGEREYRINLRRGAVAVANLVCGRHADVRHRLMAAIAGPLAELVIGCRDPMTITAPEVDAACREAMRTLGPPGEEGPVTPDVAHDAAQLALRLVIENTPVIRAVADSIAVGDPIPAWRVRVIAQMAQRGGILDPLRPGSVGAPP